MRLVGVKDCFRRNWVEKGEGDKVMDSNNLSISKKEGQGVYFTEAGVDDSQASLDVIGGHLLATQGLMPHRLIVPRPVSFGPLPHSQPLNNLHLCLEALISFILLEHLNHNVLKHNAIHLRNIGLNALGFEASQHNLDY